MRYFTSGIRILVPIALMLLIFNFSHQPGGESGALSRLITYILKGVGIDFFAVFGSKASFMVRKLAHFTEYGVLCITIAQAFALRLEWRKALWWGMALAILYASTDEFHQTFIPGRVGTWSDVLVDGSGAVCYALVGNWFIKDIRRPFIRRATRKP